MDIIAEDEVYRYKRDSKYIKRFNDKLLPILKERTKTEPYVLFDEENIRKILGVDKFTKFHNIYGRLRTILKYSNVGLSYRDHSSGNKVIVFYAK